MHNAGVTSVGCVEEMPAETWVQMFSTNPFGPARLTAELLPSMRAAGRGRIVVVSSQAGVRGMLTTGAYSAVKGALERWAESLAEEVTPFGLGVTILVPGAFRTDILVETRTFGDPDGPYGRHHAGVERSGRLMIRLAAEPGRFAPALERALTDDPLRLAAVTPPSGEPEHG